MAEKVMSIHQALAELKLYDNKIWKGLNKSFVTYTKKGNDKIGSYTIQEYSDLLKVFRLSEYHNMLMVAKSHTYLFNSYIKSRVHKKKFSSSED